MTHDKDIFEAAKTGTAEDMKYYIETQGVDVNTKDDKGLTPLHYVAGHNPNVEVAKYLIEHGADIHAKSNSGYTPFNVAWQHAPNEEVGIYFLDQMIGSKGRLITDPAMMSDPNLRKAFVWSKMVAGNWHSLKDWIQNDRSLIDTTGKATFAGREHEMSLLHLALTQENPDIKLLEYLISAGAKVDARIKFNVLYEKEGKTRNRTLFTPSPLHFAIESKASVEVLQLLVRTGADVQASYGTDTPLHWAVHKHGDIAVIKYLIDEGADVNAKGIGGNTPLHTAAKWNPHVEVVKYLIERGANVHAENKDGKTPLDVADTDEKKRILQDTMIR